MNTPTTRTKPHRRGFSAMQPLRIRAELRPITAPRRPATLAAFAENDFLVSNPRPDLTADSQTLRMFETG
jgi:hypothetical protein